MLIHPWDAMTEAEALGFVASVGFGHLVAPGRGRDLPVVVPTQYVVAEADPLVLLLHLARPNPVWPALAEHPRALLSIQGPWAYVPSSWKALPGTDDDPRLGIPTTFYAAAQVEADVEVLDGEDLLDVLRAQLADLQPDIDVADPEVHARRLPGIRGLRLRATAVRGKRKEGGNLDDAHREHILGLLAGPA